MLFVLYLSPPLCNAVPPYAWALQATLLQFLPLHKSLDLSQTHNRELIVFSILFL